LRERLRKQLNQSTSKTVTNILRERLVTNSYLVCFIKNMEVFEENKINETEEIIKNDRDENKMSPKFLFIRQIDANSALNKLGHKLKL
jgi:hypothetical protein